MATSPKSAADLLPAQLAKAALRRLVLDKLEPTPENYARAYQQEMGSTGETMPAPLAAETHPAPLDEAPPLQRVALQMPSEKASGVIGDWNRVVGSLDGTVRSALPVNEGDGRTLAEAIADATRRIQI